MQPNINLKTKTSCTTIRLPPLPLLRKYTFACSLHKKTKTTLFFTQTQCPNETPDYLTKTRQSLVSPHLILFERLMMRATKWKKNANLRTQAGCRYSAAFTFPRIKLCCRAIKNANVYKCP